MTAKRTFDPECNPSSTYRIYKSVMAKAPSKALGRGVFSVLASLKAPYFVTVQPRVQELRPGLCRVRVAKWWLLQNHIKTFHAIAACNTAEFAMGMLTEASLPATHRWLPMGMRTEYVKKTTGGLTATATADFPEFSQITKESGGQKVTVRIQFVDDAGVESVKAEIDVWVTAK